MGEDEVMVLMFSGMLAFVMWGIWYFRSMQIAELFGAGSQHMILWLAPVASAVLLFMVLRIWASHDVRDAPQYLVMYSLMGAAWVGSVAILMFPWMGLHFIHDAIERRNMPSALAIASAVAGFTLAFAGGNIGDGPGWWVVVFSSGLATGTLATCWFALSQGANMAEEISVDRDMAAGLRLGGFLIAGGVICGRGAAGNWVSAGATIADFMSVAWAIIPLLAVTWLFDYFGSPTPENPRPEPVLYGGVPATFCIGAALAMVFLWGKW